MLQPRRRPSASARRRRPSSPTYCSPSRPEVRILADGVLRKLVALVDVHASPRASKLSLSKRMSATRPTTTPALFTGARTLRPPMLSNSRRHAGRSRRCVNVPRLPTLSARNSSAASPTATKMPTHRSSVVRFHRQAPREHECGQDEIERQDRQRRRHHRARGRARHAFGGRRRVVALEQGDPGHRDAEHDTLDDAVQDVLAQIDRRLHLRPERALVHADQHHADQVAAEDAHRARTSPPAAASRSRRPRSAAPTTRAIGSTAIISIAESCSVAFIRPISAVIAEPARLANSSAATTGPSSRTSDSATSDAERLRRAVALQRVVALQAEHHADEQARHQDDDQRQHAGEVDLAHGQAEAPEARARVAAA